MVKWFPIKYVDKMANFNPKRKVLVFLALLTTHLQQDKMNMQSINLLKIFPNIMIITKKLNFLILFSSNRFIFLVTTLLAFYL